MLLLIEIHLMDWILLFVNFILRRRESLKFFPCWFQTDTRVLNFSWRNSWRQQATHPPNYKNTLLYPYWWIECLKYPTIYWQPWFISIFIQPVWSFKSSQDQLFYDKMSWQFNSLFSQLMCRVIYGLWQDCLTNFQHQGVFLRKANLNLVDMFLIACPSAIATFCLLFYLFSIYWMNPSGAAGSLQPSSSTNPQYTLFFH